MRFDTPVYFVSIKETSYNEVTGNYETPDEAYRLYRANIIDTTAELKMIVYGQLSQESKTVYVKGSVAGVPDYIDIGGKRYKIDKIRNRKIRSSFVISEVQ